MGANPNPPSVLRMFTVMRERVLAGEPWREVLADYGLSGGCGKVCFRTQSEAIIHAAKGFTASRSNFQARAYPCDKCRAWHLTGRRK